MSTKHSPLIRLTAAKRALSLATDYCPHWDMDSNPAGERMDGHEECCAQVRGAAHEVRLARQAMERAA